MKKILISQLHSSLTMLQEAINHCPEELWEDPGYENQYWHIVYHALFFTDFYLSPSEDKHESWEKARADYQFMGPVPWPPHYKPAIEHSYSKEDLQEYLEQIKQEAPQQIEQDDLNAESGFGWLPFNRMELHIYSIRHLQHHTGQLIERLRNSGVTGHRMMIKM